MKYFVKIIASALFVVSITACSPQATNRTQNAAPTETAADFIARANAELEELSSEIGAAEWVRSTYITHDTAIIAAAASEKYAEWHGAAGAAIRRSGTYAGNATGDRSLEARNDTTDAK